MRKLPLLLAQFLILAPASGIADIADIADIAAANAGAPAASSEAASPAASAAQEYTPQALETFPTELLWGDLHVHSSFSFDANVTGNIRLEPADAYRFARGEAVVANSGMTARLEQPLDFLVVSDHSENMGLLPALRAGDPALMSNPKARDLAARLANAEEGDLSIIAELVDTVASGGGAFIDNKAFEEGIWSRITRQADAANDPGKFTALIGFEWSSMPAGDNLHRVVVYRDGADRVGQMRPASSFDGDQPEDLWSFMEEYERQVGGEILAIPHNANLSNGRMFALTQSDGRPMDAAYAKRRARLEPLVEVTQYKGDAETHPALSPNDAFADFETWDYGNLSASNVVPKQDWMLQFEYARSALGLGLQVAAESGTNPFEFGMIGSTDSHTSLAAATEDAYWGKLTSMEPGPRTWVANNNPVDPATIPTTPWDFGASGYTGVWASENTREAIFDALRRREVYATTGSRLGLRFFGGYAFKEGDADRPDLARHGYRTGVPMGQVLEGAKGRTPTFLVAATKDPLGANLDRIQIVKGWLDADGSTREQVYDVALSDGRRALFGRIRGLKSTVDTNQAQYSNEVGAAELRAVWSDPDFNPSESAFYYARVIEIAQPRWNVYDAARLGAKVPKSVPTEVQDRAYSSPIWHRP
ncbi:MAG: DUF3604 domain-containing protein [Myxococcota bacterium]